MASKHDIEKATMRIDQVPPRYWTHVIFPSAGAMEYLATQAKEVITLNSAHEMPTIITHFINPRLTSHTTRALCGSYVLKRNDI